MSEGRLQFDDRTYELPLVELRFYNAGGDWNLGRDGVFWLSGRASPGPASTADLANVELTIDERALDEMLAAVTGVSKTFYPPGGLSGPSLHLEVTPSVESTAMISLRTELDWDYHPATTKPPDYARHRVVLELRAAIVFAR